MEKLKFVTCVCGVDERTQNHHFCQSPFLTIHRTLDRHCNEVDCNENFLQFTCLKNWVKLLVNSILTSVDSVAYSKCSAANDSVLDTPKLAPNDHYHDLTTQYQHINYNYQSIIVSQHLRFFRLSFLSGSSSSLSAAGIVGFCL